MILRNTDSQPILIGPLLATSDGTPQTTGANIAVRRDGIDVGSPGGTLSHVTDGVWQYIPTQEETDCAILGLILTKADSIAVPLNVPTTRIPIQTAAGTNGGLPTVDANNHIAGIQGTITTLDALDTAQDLQHAATQAAIADIDAAIVSGIVTVVSPVSADGTEIRIIQGDDYYAADGRALEFSSDSWPDLTSATVVFIAARGSSSLSVAATVHDAGEATQTVVIELSSAHTAALAPRSHEWKLEATLDSSDHIVTLASGLMDVVSDINAE